MTTTSAVRELPPPPRHRPPVSRAAARSRRRPPASRRNRPTWITYAVLIIAALLAVFPLYWMFVVGSNDTSAVSQNPPTFAPGGNFIDNIISVNDQAPFARSLLNSAVVSVAVAALQVFFCSLAGFAFAKLRFRGRGPLFVFVVATMAIPGQLGLIPMYMIMNQLGWLNTYWALIVPGAVSAFGVFWMRQVVAGTIPDEMVDAARIDGCSTFRLYWLVVVPNIRGSAAVFGLFAAMATWNDFLWPLIVLNSPDNFTSQVAIQQFRTQYTVDYSLVMTASVLATLPLLLLFVLAGKQLVAGIMDGAFKG